MTEYEKMQHAKTYIDKLANGINPIDDTPAAPTDIINNISISRCLFYVSDILGRAIRHGGEFGEAKAGKAPFYISAEEISRFKPSQKPISASEIAKRINSLASPENCVKLRYGDIAVWLIKIGMLMEQTDIDGKTVKRPTDKGRDLGISIENRIGMSGNRYTVVVYNQEAQQFIVDNIEAVMDSIKTQKAQKKNSEKANKQAFPDNRHNSMTSERDQLLTDLYSKHVSVPVIASTLGEAEADVRERLKNLGLLNK